MRFEDNPIRRIPLMTLAHNFIVDNLVINMKEN